MHMWKLNPPQCCRWQSRTEAADLCMQEYTNASIMKCAHTGVHGVVVQCTSLSSTQVSSSIHSTGMAAKKCPACRIQTRAEMQAWHIGAMAHHCSTARHTSMIDSGMRVSVTMRPQRPRECSTCMY
eukprot:1144702-Pelagomonas_calceolata.AAC.3